jgi:hypothetical protein
VEECRAKIVWKAAENKFVLTFSSFHQFDEILNGYFSFHADWAIRSLPGQLSVVSFNFLFFSGQL